MPKIKVIIEVPKGKYCFTKKVYGECCGHFYNEYCYVFNKYLTGDFLHIKKLPECLKSKVKDG